MGMSFNFKTCTIFFTILILLIQIPVLAQDSVSTFTEDLFEMNLEELMNVKVTSLSKRSEESSKAPGTVYVWTEEQIKSYGFRNLQDVLEATPGFEITNFYFWLNGGQRGYNNNMAGTLVLVNGRRMKHTSLQIGVHNLFDEEYHHINGRGTSPIQYLQESRAFMLSCKMLF